MFVRASIYRRDLRQAEIALRGEQNSHEQTKHKLETVKTLHRLQIKATADLISEREALKIELEEVKKGIFTTDGHSEDGITIGLIDALITIGHILNGRDMANLEVQEALADLRDDEDRIGIVEKADTAKRVIF